MAHFEWSKDLELEIAEVDNQHKEIVKHINIIASLNDDFVSGKNPTVDALLFAFDKLADVARKHFEEEEELMDIYQFPDMDSHKIIHRNLFARLSKFRIDAENEGFAIMIKLLTFLNTWLKGHIMGVDTKYASHIHKSKHKGAA
ncbi:MAG: bacteriohemerythrin [Bdellovibrionota bacterium]